MCPPIPLWAGAVDWVGMVDGIGMILPVRINGMPLGDTAMGEILRLAETRQASMHKWGGRQAKGPKTIWRRRQNFFASFFRFPLYVLFF